MSLWRHGDFLRLWAAQAVSSLGARITREGLPFAAVMSLGASPAEVGVLAALSRGPAILVGWFGGGFVDRRRRRGVMIAADLARALALATIPLAYALHRLTLAQLYGVAAVVGALSVLFDLADHAYLPGLIGKDRLVDGNAKLATTESLAEVGGPALYGVLFQLLSAPAAIAANAATYLFSAVALTTIRRREPPPGLGRRPRHPAADAAAGWAVIRADRPLAALLALSTASALFNGFVSALYMIFALRTLHLTAAMLGATVALGGLASLAGAALAGRLIRRLGLGPATVIAGAIAAAGAAFIAAAPGAAVAGMLMLMAAQLVGDSAGTIAEIASRSLRQTRVAPELMGRVGGVFALALGVTGVSGAVLGGWMGGSVGVRATLWIAVAGLVGLQLVALASPIMRARDGAGIGGGAQSPATDSIET